MAQEPVQELTYTLMPRMYKCRRCEAETGSERIDGQDQNGAPVTFYQPASRYWLSKGHPQYNQGVFCSAECAVAFVHP